MKYFSLLLIQLLFLVKFGIGKSDSYGRIVECVNRQMRLKNWKKKTESQQFHLHFEGPVVEILHVLSKSDLKRIEYVAQCVESEYPQFREPSSPAQLSLRRNRGDLHLGSGNVTLITEFYRQIIPDIHEKIILAARKVVGSINWHSYHRVEELGIRSAQLVNFNSGIRMKSRAELKELQELKAEEKKSFVVHAHPKPQELDKFDPYADPNVEPFVVLPRSAGYMIYVPLKSRERYHGGELCVEEPRRGAADVNGDGDVYDEEDEHEPELEEDLQQERNRPTKAKSEYKFKHSQFNILETKYSRHVSDPGGVLLVRNDAPYGFQPVQRGSNSYLAVELWPFADTELSLDAHSAGASLDDAWWPKVENAKAWSAPKAAEL